jgi:hypothetical protein
MWAAINKKKAAAPPSHAAAAVTRDMVWWAQARNCTEGNIQISTSISVLFSAWLFLWTSVTPHWELSLRSYLVQRWKRVSHAASHQLLSVWWWRPILPTQNHQKHHHQDWVYWLMMKNTAKRHVFLRFDFTQAAKKKCNKTHKTESRNLKATFFSSV